MGESGCSICLEIRDTEPERGVVITGCCKNLFHLDCIIQLYQVNKDYVCPLCRGKMDAVTPACPENINSDRQAVVHDLDDNSYIIDSGDEEEEHNSSSNSESEEDEELVTPGSLSINTDQVYIYCVPNSGKVYVKDKLSQKPITELEISHDLPVVEHIKCEIIYADSHYVNNPTYHIVITYACHCYIYVINDVKLVARYQLVTRSCILDMDISSYIYTVSVNITLSSGPRGMFTYHKSSYDILGCSPWLCRT